VGYPDPDTFHATWPLLTGWLDDLLAEHGIEHSRLVLGGFSQGTVMAYALALGAGRPAPAGLIALSGFLPTLEGFALDLDDRTGLRVAIGHGENDPIIGVEWGRDARDRLTAAGVDVLYHEHPGGHHIDPRFLGELPGWLTSTIGVAPTEAPG
jgi:phospholipase/carboxylesterase